MNREPSSSRKDSLSAADPDPASAEKPSFPRSLLPRHIAIIMDGNGRWAAGRGLARIRGHEEGARIVRRTTEECARLGIHWLTLYAFSSENWKRPPAEVKFLMKLLSRYLIQERPTIMKNDIRFRTVGRIHELPKEVQKEIAKTTSESQRNTGTVLCLALNYGGRDEIVDAACRMANAVRGALPGDPEKNFRELLYDPDMPDVDLLIRTGGEMRMSNFLLWQLSYAELYFTPVFWPDFTEQNLHEAIRAFVSRERRFGTV